MPQLGKKILASGNGRCNLLNERIDETHYNKSARPLVKATFGSFGRESIKSFFNDLGLELYADGEGRLFPVTNQSASVLKVLEIELKRLSIPIELNFDAADIASSTNGFIVTSKADKKITCRSVILTGGGKTYPALGSDGSTYKLAQRFGHTLIEPVPAAVPLVVKDPLCHALQGQKIFAKAKCVIEGKVTSEASGELLFTRHGLSGTCILDISEEISVRINRYRKKDAVVSVDMVPFMREEALNKELAKRLKKGLTVHELLAGILPNKFGIALKDLLQTVAAEKIASGLKDRRFEVAGTRGWNEADFTAGGIDASQVSETTLKSKLKKGLYFAGEVLDVNGARGGYNLAWAWASGFVAGLQG